MTDLRGWRVTSLADRLTLSPPSGADAGAIQIRERVAPLTPMVRLVEEERARAAEVLADVTVGLARRLTTDEGEEAALVGLVGRDPAGRSIERGLGVVAGDRFYQSICPFAGP
jgi:hypothetical protein